MLVYASRPVNLPVCLVRTVPGSARMLAVRDVQITVEVGAADAAPDASRPVQTHVVPDAPQAQDDREEVVKWRVQAVLLAARLDAVPPALEIVQEPPLETAVGVGLLALRTARLCALQLAVVTAVEVVQQFAQ